MDPCGKGVWGSQRERAAADPSRRAMSLATLTLQNSITREELFWLVTARERGILTCLSARNKGRCLARQLALPPVNSTTISERWCGMTREELLERIRGEAEVLVQHSIGSVDPEDNAKAIALKDEQTISFLADRLEENLALIRFSAVVRQSPNLLDYELLMEFSESEGKSELLKAASSAKDARRATIEVNIPARIVKSIKYPVTDVHESSSRVAPFALVEGGEPIRTYSPAASTTLTGLTQLTPTPFPDDPVRREQLRQILSEKFGLTLDEVDSVAPMAATGDTPYNTVERKTTHKIRQTPVGTNTYTPHPDNTTDYVADTTTDVTHDTRTDYRQDEF